MSSAFIRRLLEDLGADGSADAISDILNMLYCSGKHRFLFAQVDNRSNESSQNRHSCVGIKLESKEVYHGGPHGRSLALFCIIVWLVPGLAAAKSPSNTRTRTQNLKSSKRKKPTPINYQLIGNGGSSPGRKRPLVDRGFKIVAWCGEFFRSYCLLAFRCLNISYTSKFILKDDEINNPRSWCHHTDGVGFYSSPTNIHPPGNSNI